MSVITSSGGAQFAPSGFGGALPNSVPFSGTNIVNARNLPSRDHDSDFGVPTRSAIRDDEPVANQFTKSCARPAADIDMYASRDPSGDQVGEKSETALLSRGVWVFDCTSMSQIDCRSLSVIRSYELRTYATTRPSGRICGLLAHCKPNRSIPTNTAEGASRGAAETAFTEATSATKGTVFAKSVVILPSRQSR